MQLTFLLQNNILQTLFFLLFDHVTL